MWGIVPSGPTYAPPSVTDLSPSSGPLLGGTRVLLTGANLTGGSDYRPTLTAAWPVCASGWVLLGELEKYVDKKYQEDGLQYQMQNKKKNRVEDVFLGPLSSERGLTPALSNGVCTIQFLAR